MALGQALDAHRACCWCWRWAWPALHTPLALALPLLLLGIGHGLLAPPTLAGTVGLMPALAGSAAAVGGLMQQLQRRAGRLRGRPGAAPGPGEPGLLMLAVDFAGAGSAADVAAPRRRRERPPSRQGQVRTRPSPVSIDSSTNFEATWSRGEKDTLKPPKLLAPRASRPVIRPSRVSLRGRAAQAVGHHLGGQIALHAGEVGLGGRRRPSSPRPRTRA